MVFPTPTSTWPSRRDPRNEHRLAEGRSLRLDLAAARAPDYYDSSSFRVGERLASIDPDRRSTPPATPAPIVAPQQLDKVPSYIEIGKSEHARPVTGGERLPDRIMPAGDSSARRCSPTSIQPDGWPPRIFGRSWPRSIRPLRRGGGHRQRVEYGLTASASPATCGPRWRSPATSRRATSWVNKTSRHFLGAPFGGVKNSGVGREEDLEEIESYTQLKSVNIRFGCGAGAATRRSRGPECGPFLSGGAPPGARRGRRSRSRPPDHATPSGRGSPGAGCCRTR